MELLIPRRRSTAAWGGMLALLLLLASVSRAGASSAAETQVKAAFLFNFAKFVGWPGEALAPGQDFGICVLGSGADPKQMEKVLHRKQVQGRSVRVRPVTQLSEAANCQLLFVSQAELGAEEIVEALAGRSVLTVGDEDGFARRGGMVNFVRSDKKLRFVVNKRAAEEAGLSVSSHMLKLAQNVYE